MKLTKVNALPPKKRRRYANVRNNNIQAHLEAFMSDTDVKIVRVDYCANEYVDPRACCASFSAAINRCRYPVKAIQHNDEVYLIKE